MLAWKWGVMKKGGTPKADKAPFTHSTREVKMGCLKVLLDVSPTELSAVGQVLLLLLLPLL